MKKLQFICLIGGAALVMALSGCAAPRNLIRTNNYAIETVTQSRTYFRHVWAVESGDEFRVTGKLRLKGRGGFSVPKYVEVTLADKAGSVFSSRKVKYRPRILNGTRRHRESAFTARFSKAPPHGTVIRLSNVN